MHAGSSDSAVGMRDDLAGARLPAHPLKRRGSSEQTSLWLFLLPSALMIGAVLLYPLGYALYLSLFDYNIGAGIYRFYGFGNYGELLGETRFWAALGRTFTLVSIAVAIEFTLGLAVAYGLYNLTFGVRTLSTLMFIPNVITPVVAALFLKWVFMGRWGLLDSVFIWLNIPPPDWLGSRDWAPVAVILADVWQFTPVMILVLYAALGTVDQSQIEAAKIDGAGAGTLLFRIMLPAIKPVVVFVLAIRLMDAFRFFDTIYVLTSGGPGTATETVTLYTYQLAFKTLDVGKASALGAITLVVMMAIVAALILLVGRRSGESPR